MNGAKVWRQKYAIPSWAKNASNDPARAQTGDAFPLLVTETGFCGNDEAGKGEWIRDAYERVWNPDPVVAGAIPFLLAGQHWNPMGFTWTRWGGAKNDQLQSLEPQYLAVQQMAKG